MVKFSKKNLTNTDFLVRCQKFGQFMLNKKGIIGGSIPLMLGVFSGDVWGSGQAGAREIMNSEKTLDEIIMERGAAAGNPNASAGLLLGVGTLDTGILRKTNPGVTSDLKETALSGNREKLTAEIEKAIERKKQETAAFEDLEGDIARLRSEVAVSEEPILRRFMPGRFSSGDDFASPVKRPFTPSERPLAGEVATLKVDAPEEPIRRRFIPEESIPKINFTFPELQLTKEFVDALTERETAALRGLGIKEATPEEPVTTSEESPTEEEDTSEEQETTSEESLTEEEVAQKRPASYLRSSTTESTNRSIRATTELFNLANRDLLSVKNLVDFMKAGADITSVDEFEASLLHKLTGNALLALLALRVIDVDGRDESGNPPLNFAINKEEVEIFIAAGANCFIKNKNDSDAIEAWKQMGNPNNEKIIDLLNQAKELFIACRRKRFSINSGRAKGRTKEFFKLVKKGSCTETQLIEYVKRGINLAATTKDGSTLLHLFAKGQSTEQSTELLVLLLSLKAIDVNKQNDRKNTPLHYAAEAGNLRKVKALCAAGANVLAKNQDGYTPDQLSKNAKIKKVLKDVKDIREAYEKKVSRDVDVRETYVESESFSSKNER
jgi:ankyrin repeat protein